MSEELLDLFDREEDKQAVSLFLNWIKQLSEHGRIEERDYKLLEKVYNSKEQRGGEINVSNCIREREKKNI